MDAIDCDEWTALHFTALTCLPDLAKLLITHGCNKNLKNRMKQTAPQVAVLENNIDVLEVLIDGGCDLDERSSDGWTALHVAAAKNLPDVATLLITHGCNKNLKDVYEQTALHVALQQTNTDVAEALIRGGCDLDARNCNGCSALVCAVKKGSQYLTELLIRRHCSLNIADEDGWTALHWAVEYDSNEDVQILVQHGCDKNAQTSDGTTALMTAVKNRHQLNNATIRFLVEQGCDLNLQDSRLYSTLHHAVARGRHLIVKQLVDAGCATELRTKDGLSALHLAASKGAFNIVNMLLGSNLAGCVNKVENVNVIRLVQTLHQMADFRNKAAFESLLIQTICTDCELAKEFSLLGFMIKFSSAEMCQTMLKEEDSSLVSSVFRDGQPLLHCAMQLNSYVKCKMLLDHGCDALKCWNDQTAQEYAVAHGMSNVIIRLLVERNPDRRLWMNAVRSNCFVDESVRSCVRRIGCDALTELLNSECEQEREAHRYRNTNKIPMRLSAVFPARNFYL